MFLFSDNAESLTTHVNVKKKIYFIYLPFPVSSHRTLNHPPTLHIFLTVLWYMEEYVCVLQQQFEVWVCWVTSTISLQSSMHVLNGHETSILNRDTRNSLVSCNSVKTLVWDLQRRCKLLPLAKEILRKNQFDARRFAYRITVAITQQAKANPQITNGSIALGI